MSPQADYKPPPPSPIARERFCRISVHEIDVDGERYYVRQLSAADLTTVAPLMASIDEEDVAAVAELAAVVACACLCEGDNGAPMFEQDDLPLVRQLPMKRLQPVLEAVIDLSGFNRLGSEADSGN